VRIAGLSTLAVAICLAVGVAPSATGAPTSSHVSPETFARVASGVALVRSAPACTGGSRYGYGTGFLVGPQVLVTALHGVGSPTGRRACRIQARLGGRWYDAVFAKAWYDDGAAARHVDLATLKLTRPAPGHVFEFAGSLPARGSTIATIGHPRGLPLSFHQGLLRRRVLNEGVPTIVAHLVAEGGNSGGPIIDREGRVLSLVQRPAYPAEDPAQTLSFAAGLDLTSWFGTSAAADLCRAYPNGGVPNCPADLSGPARRQWIPLRSAPR